MTGTVEEKSVLIVGSGMVTCNLLQWNLQYQGESVVWAVVFDDWLKETLLSYDESHLLEWEKCTVR